MLSLIAFTALSFALVAGEVQKFDNYKLLSVLVRDRHDAHIIQLLQEQGVDLWTSNLVANANASILVSPEIESFAMKLLNQQGMKHSVLNNNIQEAIDEEARQNERAQRLNQGRIVGTFARYAAIESWLKSTAAACGSLCVLENIGRSYGNRNIYVMRIGNNIKNGVILNRVFTDSTLHAREWLAQAAHIWIIDRMISRYGSDSSITNALNKNEYDFVVVPNPDGYEYTHTSSRLWRKTRSANTGSTCVGVDPNRNFDYAWAGEGTSSNPCSDIYHGPKAFSELETQALSNYILANKARIRAYIAQHTYCQMILVPYGHTMNSYPSDYNELLRVANSMASAMKTATGKVYQAGNTATLLGPGAGGSDDWSKGKAAIKYSYTIELRPTCNASNGFVVDASEIAPAGTELLAALTNLSTQMQ